MEALTEEATDLQDDVKKALNGDDAAIDTTSEDVT